MLLGVQIVRTNSFFRKFYGTLSKNRSMVSGEALLTPQQIELKFHTEKFSQSVVSPMAESIEKEGAIPKELWLKLGEQGFLGPTVSSDYGGLGLGYLEHVLIMEQLSRSSGSLGLSYGAHSHLCVNQISRWGTEEQKSTYLPKLLSGEWIGALAISEPSVGSDAMSICCSAVPTKEGDYTLNGVKMWITNGPCADVIVLYARVPMRKNSEITAFIINTKNLKGFSVSKKLNKIGMKGSETAELVFQNCRIPHDSVLGSTNNGAEVMMSGLDSERIILAAGPLGIMQACYDLVVPYVNSRKQFDRFVGDFQLIQSKLSSIYSDLLLLRTLLYSISQAFNKGIGDRKDCAVVIHRGSQMATRAALDTIQLLGGNGYTASYPAGRYLCDAKLYEIGAGTTEIRQILIGREINEEFRKR